MTDKLLLIQSIGRPPDRYEKWLDLIAPVNRRYARACGADYDVFMGHKDGLHPSWNRVALILDAFRSGYHKVAWLDLDTLVVNLDDSIFDGTDDTTPVHSFAAGEARNDGVLVANRTSEAVTLLGYIWERRHVEHRGLEQGWFDDYVEEHPGVFAPLAPRYNWFDWNGGFHARDESFPSQSEATILAWHTQGASRFAKMHATYRQRWEGRIDYAGPMWPN